MILVALKTIIVLILISVINADHHRDKRFLIFPRANPTRHQFIAGIGIPIDITPESMTMGYVFKAQYFLPYNESHLYPTRFEKRSIEENYLRYIAYDSAEEQNLDNYESYPNDNIRWSIYKILSLQLQKTMKVDGIRCIQMYICQATQSSFTYKSGLFSEILHVLLVPSTTTLEKNEFTYAEEMGRNNVNCRDAFKTCKLPLLDYLSSLF